MKTRIIFSCFLISLFLAGCAGLRGKGKAHYLRPDFKAPDIVGILPVDNHSNDLRAPESVKKALAGALISLGYLPLISPAQTESLRQMGLNDGGQIRAFTPSDISSKLGADSLLYIKINDFNEINIGFYQNRKVSMELALTDAKGEKLWEVEGRATNRAYNISPSAAIQALAQRVVASTLEKAFKVHMLNEASMAVLNAYRKTPEWPETNPRKLKKIKKDIRKYEKKMGKTRPLW